MSTIKARLTADMKTAMKSGEKSRLATIRMLIAAIKQREIDERREVSEDEAMAILTKQAKQRRESIAQYESAGRDDLKAVEEAELAIIETYLPQPLSPEEIEAAVAEIIAAEQATDLSQMGAVMKTARERLAGRADMAAVSQAVRSRLSA
ncbi:GatB/YqeY domain-containing protein [Guyparkeria hydrothermalis]|uniref:GatB/YqeY domain-containing protein n=1 Tax=Guyparkeria halophila TaxID=47960 RepID=A0A6I6CYS6_9GAMM|nr:MULTISPECIES: GatB/YqeY domain-containing protein [Guyparkeria]MCL7751839.1 GatB/YqeY domain-containing protein [Guyparkeria hydrothermalis]QGT77798.1 GatB/YqeY domain-containing protein [Guyparkeria halophila]TKA88763.1 GatB/YqeY domain-containing protein [Guyparkeria sp. SB14A]